MAIIVDAINAVDAIQDGVVIDVAANYKVVMYLKFYFFLISMACFNTCHASMKLSQEDSTILNTFFQTTIDKSEAGYVLYGQKPVCINGISFKDCLAPGIELHQMSVALKEGLHAWKRVNFQTDNFIIHVYVNPDSLLNDWIHFLVINRQLFLETVQSNLPLFKYILGPKVTPELLLEAVISSENSFNSVFKDNKVLIGIILGYGTFNAIQVSRCENLEDANFAVDVPPFQSLNKILSGSVVENKQSCLLLSHQEPLHSFESVPTPSFSFHSLNEELEALTAELEVSSPQLLLKSPPFIFGRVNGEETKILLQNLESTQEKIQLLLQSPTFLSEILKLLTGKEFSIDLPQKKHVIIPQTSHELNELIAKNIWFNLESTEDEYVVAFLEGFINHKEEVVFPNGCFFPEYKSIIAQTKNNIQEANDFFGTFKDNKAWTSIIPGQLSFRVLKEGFGKSLQDQSCISLDYQIFDPQQNCLITTHLLNPTPLLDLSKTIPGFAHGLRGIKVGERREILIHPSLAYGMSTFLDKGIYLRAIVTLRDIPDREKSIIPSLASLDLSFLFDPAFEKTESERYQKMARCNGVQAGKHYVKNKDLNIKEIYECVVRIQQSVPLSFLKLSEEEYNIINRIHWNIYFGM